jgi:RNA polymerase sigma factor (sigma-70 family)
MLEAEMLKEGDMQRMALAISFHFPAWIREEIYSAAVEGMLLALRRYVPSYGVKITTFVYAYAKGYAYKEWEKWKEGSLSLDYEYEDKDGDGISLGEFIEDGEDVEERVCLKLFIEELTETEEEKKILEMIKEGYSFQEIAKKLKKSRSYVWQKMKGIRERVRRKEKCGTLQ